MVLCLERRPTKLELLPPGTVPGPSPGGAPNPSSDPALIWAPVLPFALAFGFAETSVHDPDPASTPDLRLLGKVKNPSRESTGRATFQDRGSPGPQPGLLPQAGARRPSSGLPCPARPGGLWTVAPQTAVLAEPRRRGTDGAPRGAPLHRRAVTGPKFLHRQPHRPLLSADRGSLPAEPASA